MPPAASQHLVIEVQGLVVEANEGTEPLPPIEDEQTEVALGTQGQDPSETTSGRSVQPRGLHAILIKLHGLGQQITLGSNGSPLRNEADTAAAVRGDVSLRERATTAHP